MKKILKYTDDIVLVIIIIVAIIFLCAPLTSKKLVCKSSDGNITITYSNSKIKGYNVSGKISYDLITQRSYAQKVGLENYIDKFKIWFAENTDGSCE